MINFNNNFFCKTGLTVLFSSAIALLSACQTVSNQAAEGIGFREARFEEISAMRDWRECRDDAFAFDKQAKSQGSPAKYLVSADLISKCEADIGPDSSHLAQDERMRAYALSTQNYLKGGDFNKARVNLSKFKNHFSGQDLYFTDGSSFIESMEILLGQKEKPAVGELMLINVSEELKSELRRMRYWKKH